MVRLEINSDFSNSALLVGVFDFIHFGHDIGTLNNGSRATAACQHEVKRFRPRIQQLQDRMQWASRQRRLDSSAQGRTQCRPGGSPQHTVSALQGRNRAICIKTRPNSLVNQRFTVFGAEDQMNQTLGL